MTILKTAIKALIHSTFASFGITGSFLAITFTATAMNTKELVNAQFNQIMERPFKHEKYRPEAPVTYTRRGTTYIAIHNQNQDKKNTSLTQIAQQQILDEKEKVTTILRQLTPKNENELNDVQEKINRFSTRTNTIIASAKRLQKKLNLAASVGRLSSTKDDFNTLICTSFLPDNYQATIKLTNDPRIGYGIGNLNDLSSITKINDPWVTVNFEMPNIIDATKRKIDQAWHKAKVISSDLSTNEEVQESNKLCQNLAKITQKAQQLAQETQKELNKILGPTLFPLNLLDGANLSICGQTLPLIFDDNEELRALRENFEEKPTTFFFNLSDELAAKTYSMNEQTTEETRAIIITELIEEADAKKENAIENKLIKEKSPQDSDQQEHPSIFLLNSPMVQYEDDGYTHGKNGYSEKKRRNEVLTNLNNNVLTFINDREVGHINKKRKISPTETHRGLI